MGWRNCTLACTSVLAWAAAQQAQAQPVATAPAEATLGEIVVTARRRSENLQEVPQVVNAVTADTLQKLNIRQFQDIQAIVPGLSLGTNVGASATMRGVSFDAVTAAQPTVAFYLNDTLVQASHLYQTMFDIGQVEVLRGPQGTQRGVAAPSGAITVTTRKPNLSEFGGYVDASVSDLQRRNLTGALNIPVIRDVLGLRLAGVIDQGDGDGVRSIYSRIRPRQVSSAVRASLGFEPNDEFDAFLTYTHTDRTTERFVPVRGPGFPGLTPPIGDKDRVGVSDLPTESHGHFDAVTLQIDSRIIGHQLSYVGGYSHQHGVTVEDRDTGQNLPGVPFASRTITTFEGTSQEIRIASTPEPGRLFDYTVGAYYSWQANSGSNTVPASYLPPAFGSPLAPSLAAFDPRFQLPLNIPTPLNMQETSIFGTVTLHLGEKTELTGGVRRLWSQVTSDLKVVLGDGLTAVPPGVPCALAGLQPGPSAGLCIIPGGLVVAQPPQRRFSDKDTIYNVSLKHNFTPDLMAYGTVGTSFRPPFASIGLVNASNDPVLSGFQIHPAEKSRSYEVGVKWSFLDRRGRLNAAVFRQKFKNLPILTASVPYIADNGASRTVSNFAFTGNPDATVEGFDLDAAFQITPNWNVSAQYSYADGRATTGLPCNDSNFDGIPDNGPVTNVNQFPPGVLVAICPGGAVSRQPYWNAALQSEYVHPLRDNVDAYVRGLFTYYPKNARQTSAMVIDNYSLLNLYAGLRAHDGAWEAGLFVTNALKTEKLTNLNVNASNNVNSALSSYPSLVHNSGYFEKALTPRREVGLTVRYAFGSR